MDEDEVKSNYSCHICAIGNMTHEQWKNHWSFDLGHKQKIKATIHKQFFCESCDVQCAKKSEYIRHCSSKKHTGKGTVSAEELYCKKCEIQCRNKSEWSAHLETKKHNKENSQESYICEKCDYTCKKEHLWIQHQKTQKHIRNANTNGEEVPRPILKTVDQGTQSD